MKEIKLTQGCVAIVDDEDYESLSQYKWFAMRSRCIYYAGRQPSRKDGKRKTIFMHRQIMGYGEKPYIDHKNRNSLDNRKDNLRFATNSENNANKAPTRRCKSGFKGVYWSPKWKRWRVSVGGKDIGAFRNLRDSITKYNELAKKKYGQFAVLNNL